MIPLITILILSLCQQAFTDHQIKEETLVVIVKL